MNKPELNIEVYWVVLYESASTIFPIAGPFCDRVEAMDVVANAETPDNPYRLRIMRSKVQLEG